MDVLPIDGEIMEALRSGGSAMTYVVANRLRKLHKHHNGTLKTARVLRRLKALESLGKVERIRTPYAVQIGWKAK